jgi:hypothetical protein
VKESENRTIVFYQLFDSLESRSAIKLMWSNSTFK